MLRRTSPLPYPPFPLYKRVRGEKKGPEERLISHNGLSRSLQSMQAELNRQVKTDNLKKGLERRVDKRELIERVFLAFLFPLFLGRY